MPHSCITATDVFAVAGFIVGSKGAIKKTLAQLNPADEKELSALRVRVGAQETPSEPDPESSQRA